jgi:hypothetical protein
MEDEYQRVIRDPPPECKPDSAALDAGLPDQEELQGDAGDFQWCDPAKYTKAIAQATFGGRLNKQVFDNIVAHIDYDLVSPASLEVIVKLMLTSDRASSSIYVKMSSIVLPWPLPARHNEHLLSILHWIPSLICACHRLKSRTLINHTANETTMSFSLTPTPSTDNSLGLVSTLSLIHETMIIHFLRIAPDMPTRFLDKVMLDLITREAATMILPAEVAALALTTITHQQITGIAETAEITEIEITLRRIVEAIVVFAMSSLEMPHVVVAIKIAISLLPLTILATMFFGR